MISSLATYIDPDPYLFRSEIHGRTINLLERFRFICHRCKERGDILSSPQIHQQMPGIQRLQTLPFGSKNIWTETDCEVLKQMREHFLRTYAALPSNSQLAESTIKEANNCHIFGRSEGVASLFATARSGLSDEIHERAKECFRHQKNIRGNQSVSSGTMGHRTRKDDGSTYREPEYQVAVPRKLRIRETIRHVMDSATEMNTQLHNSDNKRKWDEVSDGIRKKENSFSNKRVKHKVDSFKEKYEKDKAPNRLQRREGGIEVTPMMEGKIPYSKLNKERDTSEIQKELAYPNLSSDGPWLKGLIKRLKEDEGDDYFFKPRCPDVRFVYNITTMHDV